MDEEEHIYGGPPPKIRSNIQSTIGVFSFIGQLIEVYLPKVFDIFISMSGGRMDNEGSESPSAHRKSSLPDDQKDIAPKPPKDK